MRRGLALVMLVACGGPRGPAESPPPRPVPVAAVPDAGVSADPDPDLTVDGDDVGYLLDDPEKQPGAITADGRVWKKPIDTCPDCPKAKPRTREMIARIAVPPPPDGRERCDVPGPAAMCEAPAAAATAGGAELVACAEALLARRSLGAVDGEAVALSPAGAEVIRKSVFARGLDGIALERSADRAALAGAAAVAELGRAAPSDPRRPRAAHWCGRLVEDLAAAAAPEAIAADLTCLARAASGIAELPVTTHWSGCRCAARGAKGRACFEASSVSRPFPDAPIDPRLAAALDETVDRANVALAPWGWSLAGLGVVGCHLARFERGGELRALADEAMPRLRFDHISEHVLGTACDISYAWVRTADGSVRGFSVQMLQLAMLDPDDADYDPTKARFEDWRMLVQSLGEGSYYEKLEGDLSPLPSGSVELALVIGVTLRNALVDAGLVVYGPPTNSSHWNHFHVHLPLDGAAWDEASDDATTRARREELIAPALQRAARLVAPPAPAQVEIRPAEIEGEVVEVQTGAPGQTIIQIALGSDDGVAKDATGVLLDPAGAPVAGGGFTILKVKPRAAYARLNLTFAQVHASARRVRVLILVSGRTP